MFVTASIPVWYLFSLLIDSPSKCQSLIVCVAIPTVIKSSLSLMVLLVSCTKSGLCNGYGKCFLSADSLLFRLSSWLNKPFPGDLAGRYPCPDPPPSLWHHKETFVPVASQWGPWVLIHACNKECNYVVTSCGCYLHSYLGVTLTYLTDLTVLLWAWAFFSVSTKMEACLRIKINSIYYRTFIAIFLA